MIEHRRCPERDAMGTAMELFFLFERSGGGLGTGELITDRQLKTLQTCEAGAILAEIASKAFRQFR